MDDDQYRIPDSNPPASEQSGDNAAAPANPTPDSAPDDAATAPIADAWTPVPAASGQDSGAMPAATPYTTPSAADDQATVIATSAAMPDPWNAPAPAAMNGGETGADASGAADDSTPATPTPAEPYAAPALPVYQQPATFEAPPAEIPGTGSDDSAAPATSDIPDWNTAPIQETPETPETPAVSDAAPAAPAPEPSPDPWTSAATDISADAQSGVPDATADAQPAAPAPPSYEPPAYTPPAYTPPADTAAAFAPVPDSGATNPPAPSAPAEPVAPEAPAVDAAPAAPAYTPPMYAPPPPPAYAPPPPPPAPDAGVIPPAYTPAPPPPPAYVPPQVAPTNPPAYTPAPPPMAPQQPQQPQQWQTGPMSAPPPSGPLPSGPLPPAPMGYQAPSPMAPVPQGYYQPVPPMAPQQDNTTLAIILEVVGGIFGIFGIGWLVSGNTSTGLMFLIGGFVWLAIAIVLSVVTLGIGLICIWPVDLAIMITSVIMLNNRLKQRQMGMIR